MSTIVDDSSSRIARCIREEREARGWSMGELAARSSVAKATVSKIEREETSPTAVILVRLATAFDLTLAGLMLKAERERGRLSRAAEQPTWRDPETGYRRRQVFSRTENPLEITEVEMPPGVRVPLPASSYARIRQAVWVRSGRLVVEEGGERHDLGPGDCLGFGPPADTVIANESAEPCTYVVVLARS